MQTVLHIAALTAQIARDLVGGKIIATEFYKKLRAAYFIVKKDRAKVAFGFIYHPAGSGCFCIPAGKIRIDTREKPWPVFGLDGAAITGVRHPALDRIFEIDYELSSSSGTVIVEALGPNGNLWQLDTDRGRQATLRNRKFSTGERYEPFPITSRLDPRRLTGEQLAGALAENKDRSPISSLKQAILGINDTLAHELLTRAGIIRDEFGNMSAEQVENLARTTRELCERFVADSPGYLYEMAGTVEVYPFKLVARDVQPEKFKTLSLAVMEMTSRRHSAINEADEERQVIKAVDRAIKRKRRLLTNLESDIKQAADFDQYKRYANLLQLNREQLKKGMSSITVEDLMADQSVEVTITLNPALAPNDNIENYFRRHRKGREGLEILRRRLEITQGELNQLEEMKVELEFNFETAHQKYFSDLAGLMPRDNGTTSTAIRLPYRPALLSTGLTIFIGRDGADNDRTTFEFARPYELWFHTQQCPGSHVVMKFPHKSFEPSKLEIEETAAIAAFHSKARNDSFVPVIYTERKYVRKPRKAKPGLVTVEREKSIMVAPAKETAPT